MKASEPSFMEWAVKSSETVQSGFSGVRGYSVPCELQGNYDSKSEVEDIHDDIIES